MMKLDDDDFDVRWVTIETLGKIGDPRAIPCLIDKLQDTRKPALEDQRMCDFAAEALEKIGTPEALAAVNQWREEDPSTH